jgi:hypothetical protein
MTFLENFALITMYLCMLTLTVTWTTIILKSLGVNKYGLPFIGIFYYLQSFGSDGRIYGAKKVLYAFFMAFYHGALIAICFLPIILTITN